MIASLDRFILIGMLLLKPWLITLVIGFFVGGVLTLENSKVKGYMEKARDLAYELDVKELIEGPDSAEETLRKLQVEPL